MARIGREMALDKNELVSRTDERQAGISWPIAVDAKLERLLEMARAVGEPTSRREIVACILALTDVADPEELSAMLRRYRRMRVHDLFAHDDTNVVTFTPHGPGPRRRQA